MCAKTLLRAEEAERVKFSRQGKGWRFISAADLEVAPVYSIRRAAALMNISVGRLRGMARRVERASPPLPLLLSRARWFSMLSLRAFAANRGASLMARYQRSVWASWHRGVFHRTERPSFVTTYLPRLDE